MGFEARSWMTIVGALLAGVLFGFVARLAMEHVDFLSVMSVGFVFVVPAAIGFVSAALTSRTAGWLARCAMACVTVLLFAGGAALFALEGLICVVMMLPVALLMGVLGALATLPVYPVPQNEWDAGDGPPPRKPLAAVLLLPFLVTLVEEQTDLPTETREVWSRVEIAAGKGAVWQEIIRVPRITEAERRPGFFHDIGFPYPLEATVDGEGVGAVRHASFDGGILFEEVVTEWEPGHLLSFSIDVDPESVPTTTLDQHVVIGGRSFDTLDGTYRIEEHADGFVTLHLGSRHRLSTRFNDYASMWTDAIMASIQEEILAVIHARSEAREAR